MSDTSDVLQKVGALIKLSKSDNEEEARTAAMQATRLMAEHKLVLVPQAELERVQKVIGESVALAKKYESEGRNKMLLGAALGFAASKQGLFG
jgi:Protein of unknown function (DUF2786)